MKIIFSRKGFDSASGGRPSPIINGRPVSLPIPDDRPKGQCGSKTRFSDLMLGDSGLNMGEWLSRQSGKKISADSFCHHDPYFSDGQCAFGQELAAQGHLANQGVGIGDVFLFFGLFADEEGQNSHHRIFGYMQVASILRPGKDSPPVFASHHPHFIGDRSPNNTVYVGLGGMASAASDELRLTARNQPLVSVWDVPDWLCRQRMSYHGKDSRWLDGNRVRTVGRGQEFVVEIGADNDALRGVEAWVNCMGGTLNHDIKGA